MRFIVLYFLCLCVTDITSLKMNLNGMDFFVILISTISSHYFKIFYFSKIRNCYPLLLCHELILFRTSSGAIIIKRERERSHHQRHHSGHPETQSDGGQGEREKREIFAGLWGHPNEMV